MKPLTKLTSESGNSNDGHKSDKVINTSDLSDRYLLQLI